MTEISPESIQRRSSKKEKEGDTVLEAIVLVGR
jgi:hypothetical protein